MKATLELRLFYGNFENKFAALPKLTLHGYAAAVHMGNLLRHCQAEARTLSAARRIRLIKAVENLIQTIGCDPDAVIRHGKPNAIRRSADPYANMPVLAAIAVRVADKVHRSE